MKSRRVWITGWAMTVIGMGVVLFWTIFEAIDSFSVAPIATIVGLFVILGVLALLVPIPLITATRRARAARLK